MTRAFPAPWRVVLRIDGADHRKFLQDLVTNDLDRLKDGLVYAALLTPQGKYLSDFFLAQDADGVLLDVDADQADDLLRRLTMYKLRAEVTIEKTDLSVILAYGDGAPPDGAAADPRHPALGWRLITDKPQSALAGLAQGNRSEWDAVRVSVVVPESGIELLPNESYILEQGFDRLNGVDFRKGCYVGQEVTARMRHKTELRKGLVQVRVEGDAAPGTGIEREGKTVGTLYSVAGGQGLAHLRFDRAAGEMNAGTAIITYSG